MSDARIAWEDSHGRLWQGDVRACLAAMEPESVQVCITSPPYWGLRSYSTEPQIWGGLPDCDHMLIDTPGLPPMTGGSGTASAKQVSNAGSQFGNAWAVETVEQELRKGVNLAKSPASTRGGAVKIAEVGWRRYEHATCTRCGAWRGELGSEPLHDCAGWATGSKCGACFICHLVEVFEAVKRVMRQDATLFVNLGDSYAGSGKGPTGYNGIGDQEQRQGFSTSKGARIGSVNGESGHTSGVTPPPGLKAKDLVGIPWRFALAMQAAGWWLRGDYIWSKPNPMPESVTDRCTRSHEYMFHFSKAATYFWDADAIRETSIAGHGNGQVRRAGNNQPAGRSAFDDRFTWDDDGQGRNARSVWEIATHAYPEAHFATFPPEIPRRAIRAGTSERGACAACGAPWKRVSDRIAGDTEAADRPKHLQSDKSTLSLSGHNGAGWVERGSKRVEQGWAPTCSHVGVDVVPCRVLDIFNGSGTSMVVARSLGRYAVGIELNPEYVDMSLKRVQQGVLL